MGDRFQREQERRGRELTKVVGNRQLRKRMHINILHCRKSRCQEEFKQRVKENDAKRREAAARGEKVCLKRQPEGPKAMKIVEAKEDEVEVMVPQSFIENYF